MARPTGKHSPVLIIPHKIKTENKKYTIIAVIYM